MTHDSVDCSVRSRRLNDVTHTTSDEVLDDVQKRLGNAANPRAQDANRDKTHCNNNNSECFNGNSVIEKSEKKEVHLSLMNAPPYNNEPFIPTIRWPDLIAQIFLHVGALYGLVFHLYAIKFYTLLWFVTLYLTTAIGITAGAHRLWSHKAYKASWQLRLLLTFFFTIAGQRDAYTWAHDHRVHHKYSETDADPHDARRGFLFAHVGWLFLTPHPEVVAKRKSIDMSDLENDRIVMWQKKWFLPMFALFAIGMPVLVPYYYWGENLYTSFWVNFNLRFTIILNVAFFVNSVAHMYGTRPYDKGISPAENLMVAIVALGEGWHNYHHVFPWDYKTSEFGDYKYNLSTAFIDFMAKIGWVRDRKYVSEDMIARRAARSGDGTRFLLTDAAHENPVWGVGDADICKEDLKELEKMNE